MLRLSSSFLIIPGLPFDHIELTAKDGNLHINARDNEGDLSPGKEADVFTGDNGAELLFGRDAGKKSDYAYSEGTRF